MPSHLFFDMGMGQPHAMHYIQNTCENTPIQPNTPYIGGTLATLFVYQQFSTIIPHYNSNQFVGQPREPSHSVQNEGVGRDRQSPTPDSEAVSTNNKIYLQHDGDT